MGLEAADKKTRKEGLSIISDILKENLEQKAKCRRNIKPRKEVSESSLFMPLKLRTGMG